MVDRKYYEYIDHTADLGLRVYGKNLEELFINIARAIFETQIRGKITAKKETKIDLHSESIEELFIDWCRELVYNFSMHGFIPANYDVKIDHYSLKAKLWGDIFDPKRHKIKLEIKNPTYHDFQLEKKDGYYQASIIFDV